MVRNTVTKNKEVLFIFFFIIGLFLGACGAATDQTSASGKTGLMSVSLTDGPGDFDHAWITVKEIWFHTSDASGPNEAGWLKFPLAAPVTVDLVALGNGNAPQPIWNNLTLPVGTYQQIRLFLVPTVTPNPPAGHTYFNEVVIGNNAYPLRIPDVQHGIKLNGTFQVTEGGLRSLAIDFDAGDDIIEFRSSQEYIMKPRLTYFDLADVGAIVGHIDSTAAASNSTSHFVFKAEQLNAAGTHHVVRRYSILTDSTGKFTIYPVPSGTYDLLIRGIDHQTVIIKNVPVTQGTTPTSNPTVVPMVTMTTGTDYPVSASITSPTGAWVNFYQTLQGSGEVPYEVRFRHFNPLDGKFSNFMLSSSLIRVANYSSSAINPIDVPPQEGIGGYQAIADALRYDPSAPRPVIPPSSGSATVDFGSLTVTAPWTSKAISGNINIPTAGLNRLDRGLLFAVQGGMIVNALNISDRVSTGGEYTLSNLPGGQPGAIYGVDAVGWSSNDTDRGFASPEIVDLRTSDATGVDMNMLVLP